MSVKTVQTKWGSWNGKQLGVLKRGYQAARRDSKREFTVHGQKVVTDFAKYLIEFLEGEGLVAE